MPSYCFDPCTREEAEGRIVLRSGVVLELMPITPCEARNYGGAWKPTFVFGQFETRTGKYFHICNTREAIEQWDGDPGTIPGIGFPAEDIRFPEEKGQQ